ncbi:hypothetical protein GCM10010166_02190 [Couchioplanes caeruleus subsp. azureus]|nr:hypothetical protein GCM10010166_02190 [Couchioplanes caeruleus subsp. azureus]
MQQEAPEATASVLAFGSQQAPASAAAVAVPQHGLATGAGSLAAVAAAVVPQPQPDVAAVVEVVGSAVMSISFGTVRATARLGLSSA